MPRVLSKDDVADFRDRLCEVAARLYAVKGVGGVTMRELASALGVSAMTPYRYFHDKEEIFGGRSHARLRPFRRSFGKRARPTGQFHRAWPGGGPSLYPLRVGGAVRLSFDVRSLPA